MTNKHINKFQKAVRVAKARNGITNNRELISEMCMPATTFYYKLRHCSFTQQELARLFMLLNFSEEEIISCFR